MKFMNTIKEKWNEFKKATKPFRKKFKKVWSKIYKFRDAVLAIPVVIGAIWTAIMNLAKLPGTVGINLQANGEFAASMGKGLAVLFPLLITAVCLVLMIFSKRKLFPWLISMFTLLIPVLLLLTNIYPA